MKLCAYSHLFGQPRRGAHSLRLFNIAVVDLGLTLVVAYILSIYTRYSFLSWTVILILLSLPIHYLFCVRTTLTVLLGLV
jgi:hypothetical protein